MDFTDGSVIQAVYVKGKLPLLQIEWTELEYQLDVYSAHNEQL
jgi:hypothetical protein